MERDLSWQGLLLNAVWEGTKGVEWARWTGPTTLFSTFSLQNISGKTPLGMPAAAELRWTLQTRGAERQLIKYSQREVSLLPDCPAAPQPCAHKGAVPHTAFHRNLQAFGQLSIQIQPCPFQLNKHILFVLKRHLEKVYVQAYWAGSLNLTLPSWWRKK